MIRSFADTETEAIFHEYRSGRLPGDIQRRALRTLLSIHYATDVNDLRTPPGNRLERLSGKRAGQWSIRINNQWRVCFDWREGNAWEVEIVDYH